MGLFGGKGSGSDAASVARTLRHSSGWAQMLKFLSTEESLRLLDFGPTSAGNINFVTSLGHSIYMANFVEDASRSEYLFPVREDDGPTFDVERFVAENLNFSGRMFDVVLLWDTLDYLPQPLIPRIADRLHEVMSPGGQLLAFFHAGSAPGTIQKFNAGQKQNTLDEAFTRYHLTNTDQVDLQRIGGKPILHTQTNRQVEAIFHRYSGYKFFLAKDNLREVIVTR